MHDTYRAQIAALWRHVAELTPPGAPTSGDVLVDEVITHFGPQFGLPSERRVRLGRPASVDDGWVCQLALEGRAEVAVPGAGPVDALVNAMRLVDVMLAESKGYPHLTPGYVEPARTPAEEWHPRVPDRIDDPVEDRWHVEGELRRVALGGFTRGPDLRDEALYACFVDIEEETDGPRARLGYGGSTRALLSAAKAVASYMHRHEAVSSGGVPLEGPYDAVTDALWKGVADLAVDAPPVGEIVAEDTWAFGTLHFGEAQSRRLAVGAPMAVPGGFVCHLDVEGRTSGPVAIPGRGPVDSVINAMRIAHLEFEEWFGLVPRTEADKAADAAADWDAKAPRDWRAPELEQIPDVLAEDRWRVVHPSGPRVHRVVLGRPHMNPNDPEGTCVVYVEIEGWFGPKPVYGVGPVDTLRNAAALLAGFLHLHEQVERA